MVECVKLSSYVAGGGASAGVYVRVSVCHRQPRACHVSLASRMHFLTDFILYAYVSPRLHTAQHTLRRRVHYTLGRRHGSYRERVSRSDKRERKKNQYIPRASEENFSIPLASVASEENFRYLSRA